jgi:hypothetical protein
MALRIADQSEGISTSTRGEVSPMTRTLPLRGGECAWQVPPTGLFVISPRSGTLSVRAIRTPSESAHVFPFWRSDGARAVVGLVNV